MQTWYDSSHFSALDYMWHIPSNDGASLILSESWHHSGSDESSRISRGWRCKRAGKIAMSGSSRHADRSGEDRSESCSQGCFAFVQADVVPDNAAERCSPKV